MNATSFQLGRTNLVTAIRHLRAGPGGSAVVPLVCLLLIGTASPAAATAGDLDKSFSGNGKVTTLFTGPLDSAHALVLQADGKIVAVGMSSAGNGRFGLARYSPNGTLDSSFSGNGKVTTNVGSASAAVAVAIQPDDKIVAVGPSVVDRHRVKFGLARYSPEGGLDPSFGGDGKVTTRIGSGARIGPGPGAFAVVLRPDGKIVAVGSAAVGGHARFALARYKPDGTLDPSFGGDGKVTTRVGSGSGAAAAVLQPDGKIVAVGSASVGGAHRFALARYRPDGTLDPSFGGDGKVTTRIGGGFARAVALKPDGRIVAVGVSGSLQSQHRRFALARYSPNGSLDPSFSGNGKVIYAMQSSNGAYGVALQSDGKIVAVGDEGNRFALLRYKSNGTLDPSFGGDGKITTWVGQYAGAYAVAVQPNGKIVAAGDGGGIPGKFALVRYLGS